METEANYPIQLIAVTSTLGDITPLRFRYENGEHELITVNVDEIHARKEMTVGKGGSIIYTCASMIDDTRMLYQLRYEIGSHKWIFMKKLS
ncbi:hypothetical protein QYZ88_017615 [Lachnospiraceae bacterium C1.1]|nr:hypothetical protein [Lachnospiraceae bacterium C1.1]